MMEIRIATRESPLALWQTRTVEKYLKHLYPELEIILVPMTTQGDQILDRPLREVGGKGLFIKNLELALLEGAADLAVHSMKDVPACLEDLFEIAAVLPRENPLDAWVSETYVCFDELPQGATVGTSSLRRQAQIKFLRPDLKILPCRGNLQTRLNHVESGKMDGIILAASGLRRLGLEAKARHFFNPNQMLSAAGQGAIGIEILSENQILKDLLKPLDHELSHDLVKAERALCRVLQGSCYSPIGALAEFQGREFYLRGLVAESNGREIIRAEAFHEDPEILGQLVAEKLLAQGAEKYL